MQRLLADLAEPARRPAAAQALAAQFGAETLCIFLLDPEVDQFLPAPGFPPTLPEGRAWRTVLVACRDHGVWRGEAPYPAAGQRVPALGLSVADLILVLLGGAPREDRLDELAALLPLLAAALRGERAATVAATQVELMRRSAAEARELAEGLDAARRELERLYAEVRAALHSRDEFLASVTHDLKTPLTTVYGYVQLLQRVVQRSAAPDATLLMGLQQVERTAIRMRRQVEQLLDVARLQMALPLDLDRRPTDLTRLVRAVCEEHAANSDRHHLVLDLADGAVVGNWDALRLERLLDNLVGNAIKYSPRGGDIRVGLRRDSAPDDDWAVVTVQDGGIGIPAADLPRIFERFYRASNSVHATPGAGIGLASSRQIVEQHGGTIEVESAEQTGTLFRVRLPLGPTPPA